MSRERISLFLILLAVPLLVAACADLQQSDKRVELQPFGMWNAPNGNVEAPTDDGVRRKQEKESKNSATEDKFDVKYDRPGEHEAVDSDDPRYEELPEDTPEYFEFSPGDEDDDGSAEESQQDAEPDGGLESDVDNESTVGEDPLQDEDTAGTQSHGTGLPPVSNDRNFTSGPAGGYAG